MKRRSYIRGGAGLFAGVSLAGCLSSIPFIGGKTQPPARKARVFEDVSLDGTTLSIDLVSQPEVETRQEKVDGANAVGKPAGVVGALSPVGVARAAKGKGATGRGSGGYSSAPRGRHNWAVWHGHSDDDWREDHQDELVMASAGVGTMGVAYLGSDRAYERDPPGPQLTDESWDAKWNDPKDGVEKEVDLATMTALDETTPATDDGQSATSSPTVDEGWYRVGTKLVAQDGDVDFGWQAADFEIDREVSGLTVDKEWHVRPRV